MLAMHKVVTELAWAEKPVCQHGLHSNIQVFNPHGAGRMWYQNLLDRAALVHCTTAQQSVSERGATGSTCTVDQV